jgi:hypothetical protein
MTDALKACFTASAGEHRGLVVIDGSSRRQPLQRGALLARRALRRPMRLATT